MHVQHSINLSEHPAILLMATSYPVNAIRLISHSYASFNMGILMKSIVTGDSHMLYKPGEPTSVHHIDHIDETIIAVVKLTATGYEFIQPDEFTDIIVMQLELLE